MVIQYRESWSLKYHSVNDILVRAPPTLAKKMRKINKKIGKIVVLLLTWILSLWYLSSTFQVTFCWHVEQPENEIFIDFSGFTDVYILQAIMKYLKH